MRTKRSILEKLGLIEVKIQEGNLDITDSDAEDKDEQELKYEAVRDEIIGEKDSTDIENYNTNVESELEEEVEVEDDIKEEAAVLEDSVNTDDTNDNDEEVKKESGIEEKLDELIGSFERNKILSIEDIYRNYRLANDINKTIFMVDTLTKALPENLPVDIKRESVLNIMSVSNIEKDELLNDAYKRIDALNTVMKDTVKNTEEIVAKNEASIKDLEKRIEDLKRMSEQKVKLKEDQNTLIEYEIQKIINIVEFVKPKK